MIVKVWGDDIQKIAVLGHLPREGVRALFASENIIVQILVVAIIEFAYPHSGIGNYLKS